MLIAIIIFAVIVLLGTPVAFCLGFAATIYILIDPTLSLNIIPTMMFSGVDSFALLAIPLFVLAGYLVRESGILPGLIDLAESLVGHIRGGLSLVNVLVSMFFAGVSGAALADTAAIGSILIPPMKEEGYESEFAAAVTASSSIVGPIIPPSVAMIIYAYISGGGISVAGLFLAGLIPGVVVGVGQMILCYFISKRRNYPLIYDSFDLSRFFKALPKSILGLMVPLIIFGGIITGVFTPTEAGGVAVAYALLVGFITRKLKIKDVISGFLDAAKTSAGIFMMLATAKIVAWILSANMIPTKVGNFLTSVTNNPLIFLLLALTFLLLIGFVLEAVATMVMLIPVFAPIAGQFGVDPYHFGLLFVMIIQLALLTPPVALGLFVTSDLAKVSIEEAVKEVWPFLILSFTLVILIAVFPGIALWIPRMLGVT